MGEYVDQFFPDGGDGGLVCKRAVVDLLADWQLCAPISGVRVNNEVIADVMALPAAPTLENGLSAADYETVLAKIKAALAALQKKGGAE
jgi:hypothetical protein